MRVVNHTEWETASLRAVAKLVDGWLRTQPRPKHNGFRGSTSGRVVHVVYAGSPLLKKLPPRNTYRVAGAVTVTVPRGLDQHLRPTLEAEYLARSIAWVLAELQPVLASTSLLRKQLDAVVFLPRVPKVRDPLAARRKAELAFGGAIKRRELWERRVRLAQRRLAKWQKLEKRAAAKCAKVYDEQMAAGVAPSVPQPKRDHAESLAQGRRSSRLTLDALRVQDARQEAARAALVKRNGQMAFDQLLAQDLEAMLVQPLYDLSQGLTPGKVVRFTRYDESGLNGLLERKAEDDE